MICSAYEAPPSFPDQIMNPGTTPELTATPELLFTVEADMSRVIIVEAGHT